MKIEKYHRSFVRKTRRYFISIFALTSLVISLIYIFDSEVTIETDARDFIILGKAAEIVEQIWREGGDKPDFHCHPLGLERALNLQNNIEVNFQNKKYLIQIKKNTSGEFLTPLSRAMLGWYSQPFFGYKFTLQFNEKEASLILDESCREIYLPQRRYAYGNDSDDLKFEWDNFNRHIYIDKFLVKNYDVKSWLETRQKITNEKNSLEMPATKLTKLEMEDFCASRGKHLLSAQIRDAATFHPLKASDVNFPGRGEYVWTKNKGKSFLFQAKKNPNHFKPDFCRFLFSKECMALFLDESTFLGTPSWMGLFNVFGGPLEVVNNPIDPKHNLIASSFYFPIESSWNAIGRRAYWDGEGHEAVNFNWYGEAPDPPIEIFKVGFRCMRYAYQKEG